MSDSGNNECPLCGKDTQDGEIFCRDCQEIAQNSYPSGLLSADEEAVISAELDEEAHQGEVNNLDNALDKDETSPSTETEDKNTFLEGGCGIISALLCFLGEKEITASLLLLK